MWASGTHTLPASDSGFERESRNAFTRNKRTISEGDASDADAEAERYARLLLSDEIDVAFVGIGENGHIAFNDPPVADFKDPKTVKSRSAR